MSWDYWVGWEKQHCKAEKEVTECLVGAGTTLITEGLSIQAIPTQEAEFGEGGRQGLVGFLLCLVVLNHQDPGDQNHLPHDPLGSKPVMLRSQRLIITPVQAGSQLSLLMASSL